MKNSLYISTSMFQIMTLKEQHRKGTYSQCKYTWDDRSHAEVMQKSCRSHADLIIIHNDIFLIRLLLHYSANAAAVSTVLSDVLFSG